jgi:tricarballylate dehydrogenase
MTWAEDEQVVVVGTGLAGLAAAIAAREAGVRVVVLEKGAPEDLGGNTAFSGGLFLFAYEDASDLTSLTDRFIPALKAERIAAPAYTVEQYVDDVRGWGAGRGDEALIRVLADRSLDTMRWLVRSGVELEFGPFGAYVRDGTLHIPPGQVFQAAGEGFSRGRNVVYSLIRHAERIGVRFRFSTALADITTSDGRVTGVSAATADGIEQIRADAVVIAAGGYQGSPEMRSEHLGPEWALARVRGSRLCTGDGIAAGLRVGADRAGDWSLCHSAAIDPTTPSPQRNDDPTPLPLHAFWLGIMVNRDGQRFVDEGPGAWVNNYSKMGKAVIKQPGNQAVQIFDQRTAQLAEERQPTAPAIVADSLAELAERLDLPPAALEATVTAFNHACGEGPTDPEVIDGVGTTGIDPPKSNWAAPLDRPPFVAYRATAGLTFTYSGLRIDGDARVLDTAGRPIPGLYAAGEATGGLFFGDYRGGSALMRSATFGRIGGAGAAVYAENISA